MKRSFLPVATAARLASASFVIFSGLALLWVSALALISPQAVMDLVGVRLPSPDAASSIRGIYGGVGLSIVLSLGLALRRHLDYALGFLIMLWGFYALSRVLTMCVEGPLGAFGTQWLQTETTLALVAAALLFWRRRVSAT